MSCQNENYQNNQQNKRGNEVKAERPQFKGLLSDLGNPLSKQFGGSLHQLIPFRRILTRKIP
ncbi:hypothetical protein AR691_19930 [Bacillus amyloliquefaciens]|nr:hypothetical protein AR691_19930 [Bacillus amyloliquefaciens]